MEAFLARLPREIYYRYKYPEILINRNFRSIPKVGPYPEDVRNFFNNTKELGVLVQGLAGGSDDVKALVLQEWIVENIEYVSDESQLGLEEHWMYPSETLFTRKGDCDDGAILMANMMVASGIPYWKARINAGMVYPPSGSPGGHAYVTYYCEEGSKWVALDWCFFPDVNVPIIDKPDYKYSKLYGDGIVWFTFDREHSYAKSASAIEEWEKARDAPRVAKG
jgi:transglutaminase-like putative cysteine protease